jgi:hypothetical protein
MWLLHSGPTWTRLSVVTTFFNDLKTSLHVPLNRLAERRLARNAWMWLLHRGPPKDPGSSQRKDLTLSDTPLSITNSNTFPFLPHYRLAERRLSRNAWMWLLHSGPPGTRLSVSGRGSLVVPYQALMAQGGAPPTVSVNVADRTDAVLFATAEDGSVWEYEPKFSLPKVWRFLRRSSFLLYLEKRVLRRAIAIVSA